MKYLITAHSFPHSKKFSTQKALAATVMLLAITLQPIAFADEEISGSELEAVPESIPPIADTPAAETPSILDDIPAAETPLEVESQPEDPTPAPVSRSKRSRHPRYQFQRPTWGGMLSYAHEGLGGTPGLEGLSGEKLRALQFSYEWQPRWIQAIGVLGVGPKLSAYPILPASDALAGPTSIWSYGFRAHYQARFFREQPIVPFVGVTYEKLTYELESGLKGSATLSGLTYGGMVLLNWLEPRAAAEAFSSTGILRTYLVAEVSKASGSYSTGGEQQGDTLSFGIRLEH